MKYPGQVRIKLSTVLQAIASQQILPSPAKGVFDNMQLIFQNDVKK